MFRRADGDRHLLHEAMGFKENILENKIHQVIGRDTLFGREKASMPVALEQALEGLDDSVAEDAWKWLDENQYAAAAMMEIVVDTHPISTHDRDTETRQVCPICRKHFTIGDILISVVYKGGDGIEIAHAHEECEE